jgi:4'-phosphopantetheinyl transferase
VTVVFRPSIFGAGLPGPVPAVEVWSLEEEQIDSLVSVSDLAWLSEKERSRLDRIRGDASRRLHLGSQLLRRHALEHRAGIPKEQMRFLASEFGRPYLEGNPGNLQFNISHTQGVIVCVVTAGRGCGIDVERVPANPSLAGVVHKFLSPDEIARLGHLSPRSQREALIEYWVLKEAYLKALGCGFKRSPAEFSFFENSRGAIDVDDPKKTGPQTQRWQFHLASLRSNCLLGLALEANNSPTNPEEVTLVDISHRLRLAA